MMNPIRMLIAHCCEILGDEFSQEQVDFSDISRTYKPLPPEQQNHILKFQLQWIHFKFVFEVIFRIPVYMKSARGIQFTSKWERNMLSSDTSKIQGVRKDFFFCSSNNSCSSSFVLYFRLNIFRILWTLIGIKKLVCLQTKLTMF